MSGNQSAVLHGSGELATNDTVRISLEDAHRLGETALRTLNYTAGEARIINDQLVENALCGYTFAGLNRILAIADDPRTPQKRDPVSIVHETPSSAVLNGGNNVGYIACWRAMEIAVEKARATGFAIVGVHNSYFSGRLAYYVDVVNRAGLCCIHTGSGIPKVIPPGGAAPAFGTNPICIGLPSSRGPVILDMGTAAIQRGDLEMRARIGEELPPGIALDADGRPTRDAKAATQGGVFTFGGHKGYGLSFMIQALGLLGGSYRHAGRTQDQGYFFLVFDPGLLGPADMFMQQLSRYVDDVKATRRQDGVEEIVIPSERSYRERARQLALGSIVIDSLLFERLNRMVETHPDMPG